MSDCDRSNHWNIGQVRDQLPSKTDDFSNTRCACGCSEAEFTPPCHPKAGVEVVYDYEERVILLGCHACPNIFGKIKVEEGRNYPVSEKSPA